MARMATTMLNFTAGLNKGLRPVANKASMEALDATSKAAAQQILKTNAAQTGQKVAQKALKNTMTSGIANTIYKMDGGANFKQALKSAHMNAAGTGLDYKKVAGTAATISVAGRVASGGGLYRDRYGNVNVPGLPFI